jgi:hypothetical protein
MPPPVRRARLSEEQILRMTDAILERRRRRPRRRPWWIALVASSAAVVAISVYLLSRSPVAQLVPLALSAPGLLAEAVLADRMVLDRQTLQRLMLHELASRGTPLDEPRTELIPPDRVVLTGRAAAGPVRIELRALQAPDGRWLVGVSGMPGTRGETRVDPSGRLPAGQAVKLAVVEPERVVIELASQ